MTHGCLLIEWERRKLLLHTYHTGMNIPVAVLGAVSVLAKNKACILSRAESVNRVREANKSIGFDDRLSSGDSAAALIIAAEPCLLEPTTPALIRDLPSWGGQDSPYRLKITGGRGSVRWVLMSEEGAKIWDFDASAWLFEKISQISRRRLKRKKKAKQ